MTIVGSFQEKRRLKTPQNKIRFLVHIEKIDMNLKVVNQNHL